MNISIKRFFRALFWRDNPKAGMLFGVLLGAISRMALVLAGVYLLVDAALFHQISMETVEFFLATHPYILLCFFALILLYILALSWLYVAHIVRRTFKCRKVVAGLMAMMLFNPFGIVIALLVCAIKQKTRKTLLALASFLGVSVVAVLLALLMPSSAWQLWVLQLLVISCEGLCINAIAAFPDEQRTPKWAFAPVPLFITVIAVMAVTGTWLGHRADRLDAEVVCLAGVQWTEEDAIAFYTNGIPVTAEPYATLCSDFKFSTPKTNAYYTSSFHKNLSAEGVEAYTEFVKTNALLLSLLDEATDVTDYRLAHDKPPELGQGCSYFNDMFKSIIGWSHFYLWKLRAAVYQDDIPTVIDCLRRMQNMYSWLETSPSQIDWLAANGINGRYFAGIAQTLPRLPDDILQKLQDEVMRQLSVAEQRLRFALMNERVLFYRSARYFENILKGKAHNTGLLAIGLPLLFDFWLNCERLVYFSRLHELFTLINHGERGFYKAAEAYENGFEEGIIHLPLCTTLTPASPLRRYAQFNESRCTALAGIAAERYRRAHGKLPESLDALVPEFLGSVPLSKINDEPLMYKHGEFEIETGYGKEKKAFPANGYQVYGPVYATSKYRGDQSVHFTVSLVDAEIPPSPPAEAE